MELSNADAETSVLAGMLRHGSAYHVINAVGLVPDDFLD